MTNRRRAWLVRWAEAKRRCQPDADESVRRSAGSAMRRRGAAPPESLPEAIQALKAGFLRRHVRERKAGIHVRLGQPDSRQLGMVGGSQQIHRATHVTSTRSARASRRLRAAAISLTSTSGSHEPGPGPSRHESRGRCGFPCAALAVHGLGAPGRPGPRACREASRGAGRAAGAA